MFWHISEIIDQIKKELTIVVFLSQKGPAKNRAFTLFFYVKTVILQQRISPPLCTTRATSS